MAALPTRSPWRVPSSTARRAPARAEDIAEEGAGALPVRVVIEQNGFVTGWDEGALGFDDDAMWFSGDCSSFRLLACDIASRETGLEEIVLRGVALRHPSRLVRLRFVFLAPLRERRTHQNAFMGGIAGLRQRSHRAQAGSTSEYPPLVPRPGAAVWRPRTDVLPPPGTPDRLASWLERTGLTRILASDVAFLREIRLRRRLLNEIEREEWAS